MHIHLYTVCELYIPSRICASPEFLVFVLCIYYIRTQKLYLVYMQATYVYLYKNI